AIQAHNSACGPARPSAADSAYQFPPRWTDTGRRCAHADKRQVCVPVGKVQRQLFFAGNTKAVCAFARLHVEADGADSEQCCRECWTGKEENSLALTCAIGSHPGLPLPNQP